MRDREDVVQVVRDQHDGEPLLGQPLDELEHLLGLRDAERRRRLVEDHEARVPHHRAGDRDGLPLAAGERRHGLPDRADRRHREALHRLGRLRLHDRLLQAVEPVPRLAAEIHVLDDVEVVAEREILVDDLDPELGWRPSACGCAPSRRRRRSRRSSGVWMPDDALDERRLAGAVVADERHHLAGPDLEVDLGERLDGAEALRDPPQLEERERGRGRGGRHLAKEVGAVPRTAPIRSRSYLQYFAYVPRQTSDRFR